MIGVLIRMCDALSRFFILRGCDLRYRRGKDDDWAVIRALTVSSIAYQAHMNTQNDKTRAHNAN